jgi:putative oxidoreductase
MQATVLKMWAPRVLGVLRIMTALLFLAHGTQKLLEFPPRAFDVRPLTLIWTAGVIEVTTGILLALGLFTRAAAFLASGTMAVAYFLVHAPNSFHPALNAGEPAILFCFIFLYLVFAGPGSWSLDHHRCGRAVSGANHAG